MHVGRTITLTLLAAGIALAACRPAGGADRPGRAVVDSAAPWDAQLERFRRDLVPVAELAGLGSREALVRRFVDALERGDTAALASLTLTPVEFGYLYYPTTREALPPYELPPDLMWFRLRGESDKGLRLALHEFGGRPFGYAGHSCGEPRREGDNTVWGGCLMRRRLPTRDTALVSLFGLIVERHGRFKFVTYANRL